MIWQSHNPIGMPRSSQYKSAIWFADGEQKGVIELTMQPLVERYERALTTDVLPLEEFYNAEDYHQKYSLQRHRNVMSIFQKMYSEFDGFVNSTAAARLNGFSARQGVRALFEAEKNSYGIELSELEKIV